MYILQHGNAFPISEPNQIQNGHLHVVRMLEKAGADPLAGDICTAHSFQALLKSA
jgi:hypothetical protein